MGTAWRNYGGPRYRWGGLLTPAIKALLIANAALFLFQTFLQLLAGPEASRMFLREFGLVPLLATRGLRIWQPFTYLFLHGGLWHLLINMLVLWMFGSDIERAWGRRKFLTYYFLAGVGAGLINIAVKMAFYPLGSLPQTAVTIGASGAVYGILLAAALLFPDRQVWLIPFPLMLPMRVFVFLIGAIAFYGSLGSGGDNISHITHLGGMLVGYLYLRRGSYFFGLRNRYSDWRRRRLRRKFEVYQQKHREEPPRPPGDWVN
jgi:membrane associated rhomboid family serine protease